MMYLVVTINVFGNSMHVLKFHVDACTCTAKRTVNSYNFSVKKLSMYVNLDLVLSPNFQRNLKIGYVTTQGRGMLNAGNLNPVLF